MQMKEVKKYTVSAIATLMLCNILYTMPAEASEFINPGQIIASQSIGNSGILVDEDDLDEEAENEITSPSEHVIEQEMEAEPSDNSALAETKSSEEKTSSLNQTEDKSFDPSVSDSDKGFDKNDLDGASSLSQSANNLVSSLLEAGGLAIFLAILCVLAYFFYFKHRNLVDRDLYNPNEDDTDEI